MSAFNREKENDVAVHDETLKGKEGDVTPPPQHDLSDFDASVEKKLIRKIDLRLLPILGALYSIALIDRVNVPTPLLSFCQGLT